MFRSHRRQILLGIAVVVVGGVVWCNVSEARKPCPPFDS
jgi:hypothetical protein